jgi:hypothetical protein
VSDLSLPDGWDEAAFSRETVGPDDVAGLAATFEHEGGDADLSVVPVRYERTDGRDHVEALSGSFEHTSDGLDVHGPGEIDPRTAFALRTRFTPVSREREVVYCVTDEADDALTVACHLARACPDGEGLSDRVDDHGGAGPVGAATLSDDEAVDVALADDAERCLFAGKPTASHDLRLPLRYAVATGGYPRTDAGVVRVPTLVAGFRAVVSHAAWTEQSLAEFDPTARFERDGPGEYALPEAERVAAARAEHLSLVRLGED